MCAPVHAQVMVVIRDVLSEACFPFEHHHNV